MREKSPGSKIRIVAEHADLPSLDVKYLTNDVYAIRYDGRRNPKLYDCELRVRLDD